MAGRIPAFPGGKGLRLSEALGPPLSRVAGTNVQVDDPFHGRSDTGGPRGGAHASAKPSGPSISLLDALARL